MNNYILIFIFLLLSCKKQHFTDVTISGNVKNIVTGINISNVKLKLVKEPISNNRPISGNIVTYVETDANGNFEINSQLSDQYVYKLKIDDDRFFQFEFQNWGIITSKNISNTNSSQYVEFTTASKGYLRLNFILHTGSNIFEDTLNISLHRPDGEPYYNPSIYVTDRVEYNSYKNVELMEGDQYAQFMFTKNGVDSIFTKTYTIEPGIYTVVDINLW